MSPGVETAWSPEANFLEWMKLGGTGSAEELVPCARAESDDAMEAGFGVSEFDRADNPRKVGAERADGCVVRGFGTNGDYQKDRRARKRVDDSVRKNDLVPFFRRVHSVGFDLV